MARGRTEGNRRQGPWKDIKVCLPLETYLRLEKLLTSSFTKKPVYGQRSQVISALITRYCEELESIEKELPQ